MAQFFKAVWDAGSVDIEEFKDLFGRFRRQAAFEYPEEDVQVFVASPESFHNRIEKLMAVSDVALQEPEIAAVEFDPEILAFEVFDPASPQELVPVLLHPLLHDDDSKIALGFFTFEPAVDGFVNLTVFVDASGLRMVAG